MCVCHVCLSCVFVMCACHVCLLFSAAGDELGMLEDMITALDDIQLVQFRVRSVFLFLFIFFLCILL